MTQLQLDRAVAAATGESVRAIHCYRFSIAANDLEPEDLRLVVACPFCGRPAAYPGRTRDGALALAECDRCDVYFDFDANEVHVARTLDPSPRDDASSSAHRPMAVVAQHRPHGS